MKIADRIMNMSDEQLAEYISDIANECTSNTECHQHCYGCNEMYCEYNRCLDLMKREEG